MGTRRSRWKLLPLVWLALTVGCAVFFLSAKRLDESSVALAAPAIAGGTRMTIGGDASAPALGAPGAAEEADATKEMKETILGKTDAPEPIDVATAPAGGVPSPPPGARYDSPFAKANSKPVTAKVAFLLNTVDDYDVKTGTFTADFFVSFTSPEPMPSLALQFPNGKVETREIIADKPTFKLLRLSGSFKSPADLRKYPFDSQELKIVIEDDTRGIDQLRLVVDKERTQLARGFRAVGWQVAFAEGRTLEQSYPDRFENDDLFYSRYTFALGLDRYATSAAFKVFVPAFVIVFISLLGMWVPAEEMEVRSNSGAPMLAGAVLFHFALMQELPATSYLSRADKLMMGVYICLALGMISTWWMFIVKEHNVERVFRIARIGVPVASAVVMMLAVLA
jgi:hypothetical protein